jgi:proteasome lid subunit RPN8/RPN11
MPFLNAFSATGGGCMLSDEDRMSSHRCLFAIILWKSRCDSGIYKLKCVFFDGFETFGGNVITGIFL